MALSRTILLITICLAAASSARAQVTSGLTVDDAEVSWDLDEALFAKKGISLAACSVPEPAPQATLEAMVACWSAYDEATIDEGCPAACAALVKALGEDCIAEYNSGLAAVFEDAEEHVKKGDLATEDPELLAYLQAQEEALAGADARDVAAELEADPVGLAAYFHGQHEYYTKFAESCGGGVAMAMGPAAAPMPAMAAAAAVITAAQANESFDLDRTFFASEGLSLAACSAVPKALPAATQEAIAECWNGYDEATIAAGCPAACAAMVKDVGEACFAEYNTGLATIYGNAAEAVKVGTPIDAATLAYLQKTEDLLEGAEAHDLTAQAKAEAETLSAEFQGNADYYTASAAECAAAVEAAVVASGAARAAVAIGAAAAALLLL